MTKKITKIIPAKGYVILKPLETQKLASGIELGTNDKDMPQMGVVFKIGKPPKDGYPIDLKEGDTAVYQKYMTNKTYIAQFDTDFDFISFQNIVAVIPKENE